MKSTYLVIGAILIFAGDANGQTRSIENCINGEPTTAGGLRDDDEDGQPNSVDNCVSRANANQRDTDDDGFGNVCDADLDNNGEINAVDLGLLKAAFFDTEPNLDADLDGDGSVAAEDLAILRGSFFGAPGPNGACIADPAACAGPVDFEFDDIGDDSQGNLFVFRSNNPATIYHARRLLNGQSTCNSNISGMTHLGMQEYNRDWGFHLGGEILFHGTNIEPTDDCDQTATAVQANLATWCPENAEAACRFWCPWRSKLTREIE